MKNILLLTSLITLSATITGCKTWNHHLGHHWEQGKKGAAGWKVNADRDAQGKIVELEKAPTRLPIHDANYETTSYNAISHLLATSHPLVNTGFYDHVKSDIDPFGQLNAVLYSSTVDLNNYAKTTNFGRLQAELLATSLVQHWENDVLKMTVRETDIPIIPQQGEFILSRDIQDLADDLNAGAVLISTYSVAIDKVYLNVQLVNSDTNSIVGAVSYSMPLGPRTRGMLNDVEIAQNAQGFLQ